MQIRVQGLSSIIEGWDRARLFQSPHGQKALDAVKLFEADVRKFHPPHLADSISRRFLKGDTGQIKEGPHMRAAKQAVVNISTLDFWKRYDFALRAGRIERFERSGIETTLNSGGGTVAGFLRAVEIDRSTLADTERRARKNSALYGVFREQQDTLKQIETSREILLEIALNQVVENLDHLGNSVIAPLFAKRQTPITNFNTQLACCGSTSTAMHLAAHQALIKNQGDLVIFPSGTFDVLIAAPGAVGGQAIVIDSKDTNYKLDANKLEEYLKTLNGAKVASIVIVDPTNPSGDKYSQSELEALGKLAVEYGFKVIVDEHFFGLDLAERPHRSAAANCSFSALEIEVSGTKHKLFDHSLTIQGSSKITGTESLVLGFGLSGDVDLIANIQKILKDQGLEITEFQLMKCLDFVPGRLVELESSLSYLRRRRKDFGAIVDRSRKKDPSNPFQELAPPQYGFYTLVGVTKSIAAQHGISTSHDLSRHLLEKHGVGARSVDGMFLDPDSVSVRVNFSDITESATSALFQAFSDLKPS